MHGLSDHEENDTEITNLSLPNLAVLRVDCVNLAVAIDLISKFQPTAVHTLSIRTRRGKQGEPLVPLHTDHLGILLSSVLSLNIDLFYSEIPHIKILSELAPNVQVLSIKSDWDLDLDYPDVRQDGCLPFTQLCSSLMPGDEGISFPYLDDFKGELPVVYFGEAGQSDEQNLDGATDKLSGRIQHMLRDLLKSRETAGAVPLRLLDLSVEDFVRQRTSGKPPAFKVSFKAAATAE